MAVIGQFNAGKSIFLNSLPGKAILPAGVLPLTSVFIHVYFGESERTRITRLDHTGFQENIENLDQYISEQPNPSNNKKVLRVDIEQPLLKKNPYIRFTYSLLFFTRFVPDYLRFFNCDEPA